MKRLVDWARARWKSLIFPVLGALFVGVVFLVVLPSVADYRDVWAAMKALTWYWWIVLILAAILNVVTFGPPMMAALPGLSYRAALAVSLASNASTYIAPGGAAVGAGFTFAMLRGWGFRGRPTTLAVALTSIWNQFVTFGTPAVAILLLTLEGGENRLLGTLAWIGFAIFAAIIVGFAIGLRSDGQAHAVGDFASRMLRRLFGLIRRKPPGFSGLSFVRFRRDAIAILRERWHWLTAATLVGHYSVFLVLILTLRATNVSNDEVTIIEAFAAWSLVRVLGAIPFVPGGFGVVELGLTTALVGFGGSNAEVVAAVLIYRFLTVVPPLALGALFGATWRQHHTGWEEQEVSAEALEASEDLAATRDAVG